MLRLGFSKPVFAILLCVSLTLCAAAQSTAVKTPKYDKATETKVSGTIESLKEVPGKDEGEHFYIKLSDGSTILIHAGPDKFLKEIEAEYKVGDKIDVTGSKVKSAEGEDEILAREIVKDKNSVILRDPKGAPAWHGWNLK